MQRVSSTTATATTASSRIGATPKAASTTIPISATIAIGAWPRR